MPPFHLELVEGPSRPLGRDPLAVMVTSSLSLPEDGSVLRLFAPIPFLVIQLCYLFAVYCSFWSSPPLVDEAVLHPSCLSPFLLLKRQPFWPPIFLLQEGMGDNVKSLP